MAWTAPVTRATGYVVLASDWNNEHVNNLKYLHGDAGTVDLSAGAAVFNFADWATNGAAGVTVGMAEGHFNSGTVQTVSRSTAGGACFVTTVVGDTVNNRYLQFADGSQKWGPGGVGAATQDVTLARIGPGALKVSNGLRAVRATYAWASTVTIDASLGEHHVITVAAGNTTAWTINAINPPAATETQWMTVEIFASGATPAIPTWGAAFKAAPTSVPGTPNHAVYEFRWNGNNWVGLSVSSSFS